MYTFSPLRSGSGGDPLSDASSPMRSPIDAPTDSRFNFLKERFSKQVDVVAERLSSAKKSVPLRVTYSGDIKARKSMRNMGTGISGAQLIAAGESSSSQARLN